MVTAVSLVIPLRHAPQLRPQLHSLLHSSIHSSDSSFPLQNQTRLHDAMRLFLAERIQDLPEVLVSIYLLIGRSCQHVTVESDDTISGAEVCCAGNMLKIDLKWSEQERERERERERE